MITRTITLNLNVSCLITRHSSIRITNERIRCSLPSPKPKFAKRGAWNCHLQWQCTQSCMTYMVQEWYQWKEEELLYTNCYKQIFKSIDFRTMGLLIQITFLIRTVNHPVSFQTITLIYIHVYYIYWLVYVLKDRHWLPVKYPILDFDLSL